MIIGTARLGLGPLRDLEQLDDAIELIASIPGIDGVWVESFEDRRVLLAVHALVPTDLVAGLGSVLGGELLSCAVARDRVEAVLRERCVDDAETVDGTVVDEPEAAPRGRGAPPRWSPTAPAPADASTVLASYGMERVEVVGPEPGSTGAHEARTERAAGLPAGTGELYELSFEHAPVSKALIGLDGQVLRANRRLCELVGRTEEDLCRHELVDLAQPVGLGPEARPVREVLDGRRDRCALRTRIIRPDGVVVPARLEVSTVSGSDGTPRWFVVELLDLRDDAVARPALPSASRAA